MGHNGKIRNTKCGIEGCLRSVSGAALCSMHRTRLYRHGSVYAQTRLNGTETNQERLNFYGWTVTDTGCWEWNGTLDNEGYGTVNAVGKRGAKAHRVNYEIWVGPIPEGMKVCHSCDNRKCIAPAHLFLGTQADNMADMVSKGRWYRPEKHTSRQLEQEIICERFGLSTRETAAATGISKSYVQKIRVLRNQQGR